MPATAIGFGIPLVFDTPAQVTEAIHRDLLLSGGVRVTFYRDGVSFARLTHEGDDFVLESVHTGKHILRADVTDEARLRAHVEGFIDRNLPELGEYRRLELIVWIGA